MDKPPKFKESDYIEFELKVKRTPGDTVRILRELFEWSQKELEAKTGIPQTTLLAIENDKQNLGVERTKVLAKAFNVHPAVILFPNWKTGSA